MKIRKTLEKGICLGKHIVINPLIIPLVLSGYFGNYLNLYAITWSIALLHEATHILIGNALHIKFSKIIIMPFGVCGKLKDPLIKSPTKEIFIALSGPLFNLFICFLVENIKYFYSSPLLEYIYLASKSMAYINLIPCLPLDGGRILRAILTIYTDSLTAWRISLNLSRLISVILILSAVVLLAFSSFNFSFILIGVFLLSNLSNESKGLSQYALREILYAKEKLNKSDLTKATILIANEKLFARKLLRKLSYNKYFIVNVTDDKNRITKQLTETQILFALKHNINITLKKI